MVQVNMLEAKSQLSALVRQLEEGEQDQVIIARNGHPVAVLISYDSSKVPQRIGIAKGQTFIDEDWDFDEDNEMIARMFGAI